MNWNLIALAVTEQDIIAEIARLQRNFQFLCYGFAAAWTNASGTSLNIVLSIPSLSDPGGFWAAAWGA